MSSGMDLRKRIARRDPPKRGGKAKANPNPTIPMVKLVATLPSANVVLPKRPPKMGPVQENDTMAKVNAIKKMPNPPPTLDEAESILLAQELGSVNS